MRLLIVEDEKELCDTISKSLYESGYEVDTCYDGYEALDYILTEDYDLIVLDLNLPGMDGMDILRELRKENEETKVLILSARTRRKFCPPALQWAPYWSLRPLPDG